MAAPSGYEAIWEYVVISLTSSSDIISSDFSVATGLVEQIGDNVTKCSVGQNVVFKKEIQFNIGNATFQVIHQDNILLIAIPVVPIP